MGDMLSAARHLRTGLNGLHALQKSVSQKGGTKGWRMLLLLDTCHQLFTLFVALHGNLYLHAATYCFIGVIAFLVPERVD
jgi:hypothetical protein